jgi:hypothetical protein
MTFNPSVASAVAKVALDDQKQKAAQANAARIQGEADDPARGVGVGYGGDTYI